MTIARQKTLPVPAFSNEWLAVSLAPRSASTSISEDTIVVNLSPEPILYGDEYPVVLAPWRSTTLRNSALRQHAGVALIEVAKTTNIGALVRRWSWYGDGDETFDRNTPLFVSPHHDVGEVRVDLGLFLGRGALGARAFLLRLRLWFCPGQTDCAIHTGHAFLEVHTQIYGTGRMQKFQTQAPETLVEDVVMVPGLTHEPFPTLTQDGQWLYPWHRYFADTDCIWMAIELHPR